MRIPGTRRVRFLGISTRELVPWASVDLVSKIQYGGLGMDDCFMRAAYNEEFAMCGANGVPAALNGRMISIEPIQRLANADIRSRTLPNIVSGRKGSSLGITEPSGGSDVAGMKTTARFDGGTYVINGSKAFITGGMTSDFFVIGALTGGDGLSGISLFCGCGHIRILAHTPRPENGLVVRRSGNALF